MYHKEEKKGHVNMKMIYLSGPITGRKIWEAKRHFQRVSIILRRQAARLTNEKVEAWDPTCISDADFAWETYMKVAKEIIHDPKISAICMMKGWENSKGCMMEIMWARALGLPIIYEPGAVRA